jgi:hypothetical protein
MELLLPLGGNFDCVSGTTVAVPQWASAISIGGRWQVTAQNRAVRSLSVRNITQQRVVVHFISPCFILRILPILASNAQPTQATITNQSIMNFNDGHQPPQDY